MKVRVISSLIGLAILAAVLLMFNTVAVNIAISIIAVLAVYELLSATGCIKDRMISGLSLLFSALIPFCSVQLIYRNLIPICFTFVLLLFIVLLHRHERLHIEQIALSVMFSLMIPFSLTTLIYMRDRLGVALGIFYTMMTFGSAWLSDTGAYFAGRFFGKHKLAPVISPKKTVEGAIGGAIFAEITMQLLALLCAAIISNLIAPITVNYLALLLVVPLLTGVSIVGDLSASVIKRQYNVKDYGSIMPGHGGVMDRFDSVLMVAPVIFVISQWLPLAVKA